MTPDALRKKVTEEFNDMGLLQYLKVETSVFGELPRLFEVSHLSMRLVINDVAAVAAASSIAAEIKRDLERQGVELEYEIRPQWKVVSVFPDAMEHSADIPALSSDRFHVEVQSGDASRSLAVHVSLAGMQYLRQYVSPMPCVRRQGATHELLGDCINQKLSGCAEEYWDPVLYPSRSIDVQDLASVVRSRMSLGELELATST